MRGGAAGRVFAGGAVFRVRRVGDIALLLVQWALVLLGLFLIVTAIQLYVIETNWVSQQPRPSPGADTYVLPTRQRMVGGVTMGLVAVGLGAALFYLRRLYLSRRQ